MQLAEPDPADGGIGGLLVNHHQIFFFGKGVESGAEDEVISVRMSCMLC